jgi:hypothetical protein
MISNRMARAPGLSLSVLAKDGIRPQWDSGIDSYAMPSKMLSAASTITSPLKISLVGLRPNYRCGNRDLSGSCCADELKIKKEGATISSEMLPLRLAPRAGLEPATIRLTAERSTN